MEINEVEVNGIKYVRKDSIQSDSQHKSTEGLQYCIVRGDRSGVFAGYLEKREGKEARILQARRIWYWSGAASLSQLSSEGTKKPNECKFPAEVQWVELTDVIEVLPCTKKSFESIKSVKVWQQ